MCKIIEDMRREEREEGRREGIKEGIKEGRQEGIKEGRQKGLQEGIRSTVLRMLEAGKYALEEIADISGLPLDEVKKLQTEQNA